MARTKKEPTREAREDDINLPSGIILRPRPFPRGLIRAAISAIPDPEVPVIEFEDGSKEENPNDPDYQAAWEKVHEARLEAAARVTLAKGLEIVHLPPGIPGPDDDAWLLEADDLGLPRPDVSTPVKRWMAWLENVAVESAEQRAVIWYAVSRLTGVPEEEVLAAIRFFSRLGAWRAHLDSTLAEAREQPDD